MANYLAGIGTTAAINVANSIVPGAVTLVGAADGGFTSGEISALAFSLVGGMGSKPKALHTEYYIRERRVVRAEITVERIANVTGLGATGKYGSGFFIANVLA